LTTIKIFNSSKFSITFLLFSFLISACAGPPLDAEAIEPSYGSGSEEKTTESTAQASATPEPVATLSADQALELADLGQIAFTASAEGRRDIWLINADGSGEYNLTRGLINVFAEAPIWSPDAKTIAYDGLIGVNATRDILLVSVDAGDPEQTRLTFGDGYDCYPSYSPDGRQIVYMSERNKNRDLYIMNLDGEAEIRLTDGLAHDYEPAWSPVGDQITFVSRRTGDSEIFIMNADGSNKIPLTDSEKLDWRPAWSPDGEWIAFESWRNGNADLFIMRKDGSDLRQLTTSLAEDGHPDFSPDGRFLIFHSRRLGEYQLFVLEVENPENLWHLPTQSVRALLPTWSPIAD
jgi:tol-pal system beta propeller repeat protein TolB